ncbi:MAG: TlpA disulfide reductase family protein [Bacteroidota bacterium]
MRKYCLLIATIWVCNCVAAQTPTTATVGFKIKNAVSGTVTVSLAVNNTHFWGNKRKLSIKKDGTVLLTVPPSETGRIFFEYEGRSSYIFLQKGDKVFIEIDTAAQPSFNITGSNAAGQMLLSAKSQPQSTSQIDELLNKDSTVLQLKTHIAKEKEEKINAFKELFLQKKINAAFLFYATKRLEYVYQAAVADRVYSRWSGRTRDYRAAPEEYKAYYQTLYPDSLLNNKKGPQVFTYITYADSYLRHYLYFFKRHISGDSLLPPEAERKKMIIGYTRSKFTTNQEYLEAYELYLFYLQKQYEKSMLGLYSNFTMKYPASQYTRILDSNNREFLAYYKAASESFAPDQVLIKDYENINSVAELKEKMKGKKYFVDMWATWCGPCKEEFAYKDELNSFLKKNGIDILYLSIDDKTFDEKWKEMIKYYKLSGYHVRTNKTFSEDVSKTLNLKYIPRYMYVNEKGEIISQETARPSDKEKLYSEIASYLK